MKFHDWLRGKEINLKPKLMFVVNTDSFFMSHRLPIAQRALKNGFEVHVACRLNCFSDKMKEMGLVVHPLSLDRRSIGIFSNGRTFFQILWIFSQVRPDLVHLVTIKPVLLGGLAARLACIPRVVVAISGLGFIFTERGIKAKIRRWLVGCFYRLALKHSTLKVICQNEHDSAIVVRLTGLSHEKIDLIKGSGVDLDEYPLLPIPEGKPVVMFASRLLVDKGVREFVDAARLIKSRSWNTRFVLLGNPDTGNPNTINKNELTSWVDENVIEWWGHRSDMPKALASCNMFVLPSYYGEGLPKVLIEASACGRAIITTKHPGCRDAIEPNKTGLLVPTRDAKALAEAILVLLLDRRLCEKMGRAGRELAVKNFDVKQVVKEHMSIYKDLFVDLSQG
jgi:glycosyltransferase involved in cell wall biosynthesis